MKITKTVNIFGNEMPVELEITPADIGTCLNKQIDNNDYEQFYTLFNPMNYSHIKRQIKTILASEGKTAELDNEEYIDNLTETMEYELENEVDSNDHEVSHFRALFDKVFADNPMRRKHKYTVVLTKTVKRQVQVEAFEDEQDELQDKAIDEIDDWDYGWQDYDPWGHNGGVEMDDYTDEGEVDD